MASTHVLTHHVNVRNPRTEEVVTLEPCDGADVPKWALPALDGHPAFVEKDRTSEALVKAWSASKLAAEAATEMEA